MEEGSNCSLSISCGSKANCKLHYMMSDLKGRLEILEKARNQGMASSPAPVSQAASGRRMPWAVLASGTGVASRVKLAEIDVCGRARGAPLFDSAGAEDYPREGQENGISRKTRFSADAESISDWAHKR